MNAAPPSFMSPIGGVKKLMAWSLSAGEVRPSVEPPADAERLAQQINATSRLQLLQAKNQELVGMTTSRGQERLDRLNSKNSFVTEPAKTFEAEDEWLSDQPETVAVLKN